MEKYLWFVALLMITMVATWALLRLVPGKSKIEEVWPRLFGAIVISELLLAGLYFISPQQAEVVYYKFALTIAGAFVGFVIDRALFPYARPDGYLKRFWQHGSDEPIDKADYEIVEGYQLAFAIATLRRALIIIAVALGVTLGL